MGWYDEIEGIRVPKHPLRYKKGKQKKAKKKRDSGENQVIFVNFNFFPLPPVWENELKAGEEVVDYQEEYDHERV